MLTASTTIPIAGASELLARLCQHFAEHGIVEFDGRFAALKQVRRFVAANSNFPENAIWSRPVGGAASVAMRHAPMPRLINGTRAPRLAFPAWTTIEMATLRHLDASAW